MKSHIFNKLLYDTGFNKFLLILFIIIYIFIFYKFWSFTSVSDYFTQLSKNLQENNIDPIIFRILFMFASLLGLYIVIMLHIYSNNIQLKIDVLKNLKISKYFKRVITYFVAILLIFFTLIFFTYLTNSILTGSSFIPILLNFIMLILILSFLYKYVISIFSNQLPLFIVLLLNLIFYIPCLFLDLFKVAHNNNLTKISTIKNIIIGLIILIILFYLLKFILKKPKKYIIDGQTGFYLLQKPLYLNEKRLLARYDDLNKDYSSKPQNKTTALSPLSKNYRRPNPMHYNSNDSDTDSDNNSDYDSDNDFYNYDDKDNLKKNMKKAGLTKKFINFLTKSSISFELINNQNAYRPINNTDYRNRYNYCISSWIWINSKTNSNYSKPINILSIAGKPSIMYDTKTNELIITIFTLDQNSNIPKNIENYNNIIMTHDNQSIINKKLTLNEIIDKFNLDYESGNIIGINTDSTDNNNSNKNLFNNFNTFINNKYPNATYVEILYAVVDGKIKISGKTRIDGLKIIADLPTDNMQPAFKNLVNIANDYIYRRNHSNYVINKLTLFKSTNFPYQRWNNIVINYEGGNLDLYINNNLVKTFKQIITFNNTDDYIIGEKEGINGGIRDIIYFPYSLDRNTINKLYNKQDKSLLSNFKDYINKI